MARISTALPKGIAKTPKLRKERKKELNQGKIASSIAQKGKKDSQGKGRKIHKARTKQICGAYK